MNNNTTNPQTTRAAAAAREITMQHFNKLTPSEQERLAILAEECAEVIQVVGKILRHGFDSKNPDELSVMTNRDLLAKEIGDVAYIIEELYLNKDVSITAVQKRALVKSSRIKPYLHHQS